MNSTFERDLANCSIELTPKVINKVLSFEKRVSMNIREYLQRHINAMPTTDIILKTDLSDRSINKILAMYGIQKKKTR